MPYFKEISKEDLLESNLSYPKKASSILLQSVIIHFLNKAFALEQPPFQSFEWLKKRTLPKWDNSNDYEEYINFNGFVNEFRKFIESQKQCNINEDVIGTLKFKSNLIKVLTGQFCKKYRGIYIAVFYWVLCELIAATDAILERDYDKKYIELAEDGKPKNVTDFSILKCDSLVSNKDAILNFINTTNYLRVLIKYASSLNIAYLLHSDFITAINEFVNNRNDLKKQIQSGYKSIKSQEERDELRKKYRKNRYAFENFKVYCTAHISRSLYENQQRAIQFEKNLNELYKDKSIEDKTFLELLLLENTGIIRQTLEKIKNENELQKSNPLLDDYYNFNTNKDKDKMFEKIRLANELQKDLKKAENEVFTENEEKEILKEIAQIVGYDTTDGGGILLYKYQKETKIKDYRVIGKYIDKDILADYFENNADQESFTIKLLEGITYWQETEPAVQYQWTGYALRKDGNEWTGQNGETEITIDNKIQKYSGFSDIQMLKNIANRILFIRISSNEDLKGEAVFVFYDNNNDKGRQYNSFLDTRFIHVLRNDIRRYLEKKYDNDTFKAWVEEVKKQKLFKLPDHNYYHNLADLQIAIKQGNTERIYFLYKLIFKKRDLREFMSGNKNIDSFTLNNFNVKNKITEYANMIFSNFLNNYIEYDIDENLKLNFYEVLFREVIVEYLRNIRSVLKIGLPTNCASTCQIKISANQNESNNQIEFEIKNNFFVKEKSIAIIEEINKNGYISMIAKEKGLQFNMKLLEKIGSNKPIIQATIIDAETEIGEFNVKFNIKNI